MSNYLSKIENEIPKFPKLFSEILKEYNLTTYGLAEKSGVDRTILAKSQKGTRMLSVDNFKKIINVMDLSPQDDELLRSAFIEYSFGTERYKTFHALIPYASNSVSGGEDTSSIHVSLSFNDAILKLDSKSDIANALKSVIDGEFLDKDKTGRIYTNIDLFTMYDFLKSHPKTENQSIDYKHIFEIKKDNKSNSEILFRTLSIMMLGYPVNYFTVESYHTDSSVNLFSYYIITGDILLVADRDLKSGYAIKNKRTADIFAERFNKVFAHSIPFIENSEDIMLLKGNMLTNCRSNYDFHANFGAFGNCVFYMEKDMWRQIAKPTVPNREFLIGNTYEYYQAYYQRFEKLIAVMPRSELTNFVDYGIVMLMPKEFADPLTPENRLRILTSFREAILSGKESFYLIKDKVLNESKTNQTELFYSEKGDSTLVFENEIASKQMHFLGNNAMFIKEKNIIEEYKLFLDHLLISGDCYSQEESMKVLEEEIDRCILLGQ
ncbi:MAG: helix-turn-helix transcriptional regulator [Ruminococcus sp.]|nr:helix-turn-helix transcriptional regulator [Ruminococcus sp.]